MKKRISAEKMKFQKFIMLLRAVHLLWKTIPLVKIEFNWKTSMGSFLGKEGGGGKWNMLIRNDKDSNKSLLENAHLIWSKTSFFEWKYTGYIRPAF